MTDHELTWDKRLQIKTTGRDEENADQYRYPYEPTPYCVLERLEKHGLIGKNDVVLDYGCGKGRVDFFLSSQTKANAIGIEYDERINTCNRNYSSSFYKYWIIFYFIKRNIFFISHKFFTSFKIIPNTFGNKEFLNSTIN